MGKKQWGWIGLLGLGAGTLFYSRRRLLAAALRLPPVRIENIQRRTLRVPMADGVWLTADHYRPAAAGAGPTVLVRTPYDRRRQRFFAERFAERGYQVVVQDTRGRFDSEGAFKPRVHEQSDGVETIAWIRRQPWSDGRVGMWGQSYLGFAQWAAAVQAPPGLLAIVPTLATARGHGMIYPQGIFSLEFMLRWLLLVEGMGRMGSQRERPFGQDRLRVLPFLSDLFLGRLWSRLPLRTLDRRAVGETVDFYQAYLDHPEETDPFWEQVDMHRHLHRVAAAAHFVSGWYDFMLQDFLADYAAYPAENRPYLTIGPWHHFDIKGYLEMLRAGLTWFDAHFGGEDRRRSRPVRLYLLGAEEWREYEQWPPPAEGMRWYLGEDGRLQPEPPQMERAATSWMYNPADPTPSLGGAVFNMNSGGDVDNRPLADRADLLRFLSPPLAAPLTVVGPVRAELFVTAESESADFFARLCVQKSDGRLLNICDGILRIRTVPGGAPAAVTVELWATAYQFQPGERIGLLLAGGAHPRWARNSGRDAPPADETQLLPSLHTIFHDRAHPAALLLPVLP